MKFKDLFPYQNRLLGLTEHLTPKEQQCDPSALSLILLANLQPGDIISLSQYTLTIEAISHEALVYNTASGASHTLTAADIKDSKLFAVLAAELPTWSPAYAHPNGHIIERDPAVFRRQDKQGWVINDALCLSSGNIRYDSAEQPPHAQEISQPSQQGEIGVTALEDNEVFAVEANENGQLGLVF